VGQRRAEALRDHTPRVERTPIQSWAYSAASDGAVAAEPSDLTNTPMLYTSSSALYRLTHAAANCALLHHSRNGRLRAYMLQPTTTPQWHQSDAGATLGFERFVISAITPFTREDATTHSNGCACSGGQVLPRGGRHVCSAEL